MAQSGDLAAVLADTVAAMCMHPSWQVRLVSAAQCQGVDPVVLAPTVVQVRFAGADSPPARYVNVRFTAAAQGWHEDAESVEAAAVAVERRTLPERLRWLADELRNNDQLHPYAAAALLDLTADELAAGHRR
jgi:hypothetical protein